MREHFICRSVCVCACVYFSHGYVCRDLCEEEVGTDQDEGGGDTRSSPQSEHSHAPTNCTCMCTYIYIMYMYYSMYMRACTCMCMFHARHLPCTTQPTAQRTYGDMEVWWSTLHMQGGGCLVSLILVHALPLPPPSSSLPSFPSSPSL